MIMALRRYCIRCGKQLLSKKPVLLLCEECSIKEKNEKKEEVSLVLCRECFRYRLGKRWYTPRIVSDNVEKYIENIFNERIVKIFRGGYETENKVIKLNYGICDECSRMHGGYYEAIIQLRGSNDFLEKEEKRIISMVHSSRMPRNFISKIVKVKGGKDIYLGSKKIAYKIVRSYDKKQYILKISHIFYGIRDGKKVSREVYLIKEKGVNNG